MVIALHRHTHTGTHTQAHTHRYTLKEHVVLLVVSDRATQAHTQRHAHTQTRIHVGLSSATSLLCVYVCALSGRRYYHRPLLNKLKRLATDPDVVADLDMSALSMILCAFAILDPGMQGVDKVFQVCGQV